MCLTALALEKVARACRLQPRDDLASLGEAVRVIRVYLFTAQPPDLIFLHTRRMIPLAT